MKTNIIQSALPRELEEERQQVLAELAKRQRTFMRWCEPLTARLAAIEGQRPMPTVYLTAETPEEIAEYERRFARL